MDTKEMIEGEPYLSIVAVSRNDDHGGNLLQRMQLFVDSLYAQCNRHQLKTELIIVEWNPLGDRVGLKDALTWPEDRGHIVTRVITVLPDVHNQFRYADKMPIFQMIGKNVGIVRARGRFILATNIDILFSDELMSYLSEKQLTEGCHYRVDRVDVDSCVMAEYTKDTLLSCCKKNILRLNKKYGTYSYRKRWDAVSVFLKHHKDQICRTKVEKDDGYPMTHSNACGDFALMAKSDWMKLGGYPELEMYSFHIDSLILVTAHYAGIREIDLVPPKEIYHIEHSAGSGWTPGKGEQQLFERLDKSGVPYLVWEDLLQYARELRDTHDPAKTFIGKNKPIWGLMGSDLPEALIQ
jgi:hypothetical protein